MMRYFLFLKNQNDGYFSYLDDLRITAPLLLLLLLPLAVAAAAAVLW